MRGALPQIAAGRRRMPARVARSGARGFSLTELMVAMTLSLILLGGVIAVFSSARTTYETTDRLSRIQESGRFALDSMVTDLRATGFIGCSFAACAIASAVGRITARAKASDQAHEGPRGGRDARKAPRRK